MTRRIEKVLLAIVVAIVVAGVAFAVVLTVTSVLTTPAVTARPAANSEQPVTSSGPPASTQPAQPGQPAQTRPPLTNAEAVVDQYYQDVNDRNYAAAWALGGRNFGQTYQQFVDGYAETASVSLGTFSSFSSGTVQVRLVATETNGTVQTYSGTYYVAGGVITSASITLTATPPSTLPSTPPTTVSTTASATATTVTTAPPATLACHPLTSGGNCYEPGEFCPAADQGVTGLAGDGEMITCENNNGLRWEPAGTPPSPAPPPPPPPPPSPPPPPTTVPPPTIAPTTVTPT